MVYLFRGPVPAKETILPDVAQAFYGPGNGAYMTQVTGPADVDGDGLTDLILGAGDLGGRNDAHGHVYVLRGPVPHADITSADTVLEGVVDEKLGSSVEALGDVNGDGLDDFAASRSIYGDETSVYVVLETPEGTYHPSDVGVEIVTHLPLRRFRSRWGWIP